MAGDSRLDIQKMAANLAHLYRGEMARADAWRARLDTTTNWALTTTAAVVTLGLGSPEITHTVFLVGMYLVINFLVIEARRYRVWDAYMTRIRLLEIGLYVPLLRNEPFELAQMRELATLLEGPRVLISFWAALGQRVKRAYAAYLGVLLVAWLVKLSVGYRRAEGASGFIAMMHVGLIPGWVVLVLVLAVYVVLGFEMVSKLLAGPPATELIAKPARRRPLSEVFARPAPPSSPSGREPANP
ncbi:MAG TPA: hypothetical protein DFS52_26385 [Myxococcales bacterium]|jgi:uncharacterized membrane protein|nr:hypothetical protein [Myxococcales bacterium]